MAENSKQEKKKPAQTPFERFEDFVRRIVRVPKSEIPPEKWSKARESESER